MKTIMKAIIKHDIKMLEVAKMTATPDVCNWYDELIEAKKEMLRTM